jgi:outer membrane lipoprotein-sorting protein
LFLTTLHAESLEEVMARMDAAAKSFQSFSANIKWTDYTAVLSDTSVRSGTVRAHKTKQGAGGIVEFTEPEPSVQRFGGRTFETYYPKANTVDIIDVGKRAGAVEQFLLLGFAIPSADLRKTYDIKLGGTEQLGGMHTSRLELTPKSAETQKVISKIELWIPEGQANPIQEKVSKPSKDYTLINYSGLKINPSLPESSFELKLPPNVRKNYPEH